MTDSLFTSLVRSDLGFDVSARAVRRSKPKFKAYQGKMSEFNETVFFNPALYNEFLNTLKSNTKCSQQ